MSDTIRDDDLTPAERRLLALLALVRSDAPRSSPAFTRAVMRAVRWQSAAKEFLSAVAGLAAAVAGGLEILRGGRKRREAP